MSSCSRLPWTLLLVLSQTPQPSSYCLSALNLALMSPSKPKNLTTPQPKLFVLPVFLMSMTHTHMYTHRCTDVCATIVKKITLLYEGTHLPTKLIESTMRHTVVLHLHWSLHTFQRSMKSLHSSLNYMSTND